VGVNAGRPDGGIARSATSGHGDLLPDEGAAVGGGPPAAGHATVGRSYPAPIGSWATNAKRGTSLAGASLQSGRGGKPPRRASRCYAPHIREVTGHAPQPCWAWMRWLTASWAEAEARFAEGA
jgi:hypothetical protein